MGSSTNATTSQRRLAAVAVLAAALTGSPAEAALVRFSGSIDQVVTFGSGTPAFLQAASIGDAITGFVSFPSVQADQEPEPGIGRYLPPFGTVQASLTIAGLTERLGADSDGSSITVENDYETPAYDAFAILINDPDRRRFGFSALDLTATALASEAIPLGLSAAAFGNIDVLFGAFVPLPNGGERFAYLTAAIDTLAYEPFPVVPAPAALPLMVSGLAALAWLGSRRDRVAE